MVGFTLGEMLGGEPIDYGLEEMVEPRRRSVRALALRRLVEASEMGDVPQAHVEADKALCDLLKALGYGDVVEAFEAVAGRRT